MYRPMNPIRADKKFKIKQEQQTIINFIFFKC